MALSTREITFASNAAGVHGRSGLAHVGRWGSWPLGAVAKLSTAEAKFQVQSESSGLDNRIDKGLGRFLRQIMASALDEVVRILARKFPGIGTGIQVRRTVGIAFKRNGRHGDDRACGEPLFQLIIF